MPGLVPGIHDFIEYDVDGRDKPGHDNMSVAATMNPLWVG
jgi:hypothetical protein